MVVIEILSSTLTALGLGLLLAAVLIRLVYGSWTRTLAITFELEGHPYLRWHDHRYRIVEALWTSRVRARDGDGAAPPPGDEVDIYYHARAPRTFSLRAPYRGTRVLAVVGLACAVVGTLLGFLPG